MLLSRNDMLKSRVIAGFVLLLFALVCILIDPNLDTIRQTGLGWSPMSIAGSVFFGLAFMSFLGPYNLRAVEFVRPEVYTFEMRKPATYIIGGVFFTMLLVFVNHFIMTM